MQVCLGVSCVPRMKHGPESLEPMCVRFVFLEYMYCTVKPDVLKTVITLALILPVPNTGIRMHVDQFSGNSCGQK